MCIFHKYIRVEDVDHSGCGRCFKENESLEWGLKKKYPKGYCPHGFKVCKRCGKSVGYGSHGKLTLIPDGCKEQIMKMRGTINKRLQEAAVKREP